MKYLNFLFCLLLSASLAYGQSNSGDESTTTVTTTIKKNPNGGYTVHSIAESSTETNAAGDPMRGGSMENADSEEDVAATVASTSADAVERLGKMTSKVKAGPNGEGDVKMGGMPGKPSKGDFPPIVITIGEGDRGPKIPTGTVVLEYKNQAQFKSSIRRDASKAVDAMLR